MYSCSFESKLSCMQDVLAQPRQRPILRARYGSHSLEDGVSFIEDMCSREDPFRTKLALAMNAFLMLSRRSCFR